MNTTKTSIRTILKKEYDKYNSANYDIRKSSKLWAVDNEYNEDIPDMVEALLDYHLSDDDLSDVISEVADNLVDIYYYKRAEWLAKNSNWQYVDEAIKEFGHSDSIMLDIAQGQYLYATNALNAIIEAVQGDN